MPFQVVEYLKTPLDEAGIKDLLQKLGMTAAALIRKNEADWKEHFRGREWTEAELISALAAYPKLMERPVVVRREKAVIGRPASNIAALLGQE